MFVDVMLVLILVSVWVGLYQLVKQQGRILLRLEQIEKQAAPAVPASPPDALTLGAAFPAFALPGLAGQTVRLEDFRGHQVLLVHWSPDCGFCEQLAPELAALESDFRERKVQPLLLAYGDAEANRKLAAEHRLTYPILLLHDTQPPEPFRRMGTPVAYLLDNEGHVTQPFAVGADEVARLARLAASRLPGENSLAESRIVRDGLKAGTPAPPFRLPAVRGGTVALEDYRGRRVLLVFSDPHCGPCDELAPRLARLEREHRRNGLSFVMVGRGDAGENLHKAEQFGIEFPVVLQEKWKLSKQYGIFATPVAFLVGEDGVILKDVAVGAEAIQALAAESMANRKG